MLWRLVWSRWLGRWYSMLLHSLRSCTVSDKSTYLVNKYLWLYKNYRKLFFFSLHTYHLFEAAIWVFGADTYVWNTSLRNKNFQISRERAYGWNHDRWTSSLRGSLRHVSQGLSWPPSPAGEGWDPEPCVPRCCSLCPHYILENGNQGFPEALPLSPWWPLSLANSPCLHALMTLVSGTRHHDHVPWVWHRYCAIDCLFCFSCAQNGNIIIHTKKISLPSPVN